MMWYNTYVFTHTHKCKYVHTQCSTYVWIVRDVSFDSTTLSNISRLLGLLPIFCFCSLHPLHTSTHFFVHLIVFSLLLCYSLLLSLYLASLSVAYQQKPYPTVRKPCTCVLGNNRHSTASYKDKITSNQIKNITLWHV